MPRFAPRDWELVGLSVCPPSCNMELVNPEY